MDARTAERVSATAPSTTLAAIRVGRCARPGTSQTMLGCAPHTRAYRDRFFGERDRVHVAHIEMQPGSASVAQRQL